MSSTLPVSPTSMVSWPAGCADHRWIASSAGQAGKTAHDDGLLGIGGVEAGGEVRAQRRSRLSTLFGCRCTSSWAIRLQSR